MNEIRFSENKSKAKDIDLKELFLIIKRHFWILALFTVISTLAGFIYEWKFSEVPNLYQTSSRVIIGADEESRKTLQVIVKDSTILDKVIEQLSLERTTESLAASIEVNSIEASQVVSIAVTDSDPKRAALIADTTAEIFRKEVPNIVGSDYVRILSKAKINIIPSNQNSTNKILIAFVVGIVLGIGFVFLLNSLDNRIRTKTEIEDTLGIAVLGSVSKMSKRNINKKNSKKIELEFRGETIGFK